MNQYCKENLNEILHVVRNLSPEEFSHPSELLSGSSLGQHIRHILELYTTLIDSPVPGIVNYDKRQRNTELERNPILSAEIIEELIAKLTKTTLDRPLILQGDFGQGDGESIEIKTSLFRELAYNLEHSIHHQALIKIGLVEMGLKSLIDENFGVAPATIRFRKSLQLAS